LSIKQHFFLDHPIVNRKSVNRSSVLKSMIGYHCL